MIYLGYIDSLMFSVQIVVDGQDQQSSAPREFMHEHAS